METQSGCEKTVQQLALLFVVRFCLSVTGSKKESSCEDRPCKHNLWLRQVVGEKIVNLQCVQWSEQKHELSRSTMTKTLSKDTVWWAGVSWFGKSVRQTTFSLTHEPAWVGIICWEEQACQLVKQNCCELKPFCSGMDWVVPAGLHATGLMRFQKWSSFHLFFRDESTSTMMSSSW